MRLLYLLLPLILSIGLGAADVPACDPITCPCCDDGDPWGICICPEDEPDATYLPLFCTDSEHADLPANGWVCSGQWCCVPGAPGCWN